jgi:SAM-dependent methyltransferase
VKADRVPLDLPPPGDGFLPRLQAISRAVAEDPTVWSEGLASEVQQIFDERADNWRTHESPEYLAPLFAALTTEDVSGGSCLDVGSGTAIHEQTLVRRFDRVVALDFSAAMLAHADPASAARVRADASALPISSGSVDAVVLVNMFLFAAEYARVLAPRGRIVFVSTRGDATPIYLDPASVRDSLTRHGGEPFEATTGRCGISLWTVAWRRNTAKGNRR